MKLQTKFSKTLNEYMFFSICKWTVNLTYCTLYLGFHSFYFRIRNALDEKSPVGTQVRVPGPDSLRVLQLTLVVRLK